ncbi:BON domain-containing protein [Opitutus sp. ER46]|uniref:BON domain-containing protein n=1 Tax=Opitutus sp. ER46 TaxID=2161864 RepID=UPI000D31592F|nr:BON domain-containing protein [Opitutus sp. ER46]PTX97916.1 transporter [Opitutus sp. ER46]
MKKSLTTILAVLALSSGIALVQTGCAGTSTQESTGEYIDDAGITTKVKAAFVRDPIVKALDVKVETFKGTVQLSGFVDSQEHKARAEQIARNVPGVQNVTNNITIK